MRQLIDVYNFVKVTKKLARELERKNPNGFVDDGFNAWHPITRVVKERYKKRYWYRRFTNSDISYICADAIKKYEYLEGVTQEQYGVKIDTVRLTDDGRGITGKVMFVPWILIEKILTDHSKTIVFISGVISSGIIIALWSIIKTVFKI